MAFDKTRPLGSGLISDIDTLIQANNAVVCKRSIFWLSGYPAVGTEQGIQYTMPTDGTITKAWAVMTASPTGAAVLVDININGTSIWASTQANRLTVADGAPTKKGNQTAFDTVAFVAGDVISMDIDQVGSTTSGTGLTVQLDFELA
jgi:hypothetical protein